MADGGAAAEGGGGGAVGSVAWSGGAVGAVDATAVSSRARLLSEASCAARLAAAFAFQSAAREVGCESMLTLSLSHAGKRPRASYK